MQANNRMEFELERNPEEKAIFKHMIVITNQRWKVEQKYFFKSLKDIKNFKRIMFGLGWIAK